MNDHNHGEHGSSNALPKDAVELKTLLSSHLDSQVDNLDFNITSRLSAARHRALAGEQRQGRHSMGISRFALTGGLCAAVLVTLLVTQMNSDPDVSPTPQVAQIDSADLPDPADRQTHIVEDLQLLSATDDIDFYESLEFLEWMETNSG